jgi:hypothetical protein
VRNPAGFGVDADFFVICYTAHAFGCRDCGQLKTDGDPSPQGNIMNLAFRCSGLVCSLLLLSGCAANTPTTDSPSAVAPTAVLSPPSDAGATVTAFAAAMKDGRIEQAYDLLPASYQKDVDGVVHEFAGQMDGEIWSAGFGVLSNGATVLKTKKDLLISMASQPGKEEQVELMKKHWDVLVEGVEKLATSDLAEIQKVKTKPARELMQQGVGPLVKALMSMGTVRTQDGTTTIADLQQITTEVLESSDTTAKVKITTKGKAEPETVEFAKVEGKWIPKSMADEWAGNIAKAREQIKAIDPDAIAAQKPKVMQFITTANGVLDEMNKAETAEQIQQAAFPLVLQAMMMGSQMGPMGGPTKPRTSAPAAAGITITIAKDLTDEEQEKFELVLKELVDDSDNRSITMATVDGKTIVTVSPVGDIEIFAKKLTVAKELEVDADGRAITIQKMEFE